MDEETTKATPIKTPLYEDVFEKLLKALKDSKGIIYVACNNVGIDRTTYYRWMEMYPDFKEKVDEINESTIDFVESKLIEKVNGVEVRKGVDDEGNDIVYDLPPSDTAIIFFLKTRAKKRGYVERQEFAGPDGSNLFTDKTDDDLKTLLTETLSKLNEGSK